MVSFGLYSSVLELTSIKNKLIANERKNCKLRCNLTPLQAYVEIFIQFKKNNFLKQYLTS